MGFLYPTEELKTYGYQTQTNIKYVLVLSDTMASDGNIHQFFKHFHKIWVAAVREMRHHCPLPRCRISGDVLM
jgi:hypothetical protein